MFLPAQFEQYRTLYELWGNPEQLNGLSGGLLMPSVLLCHQAPSQCRTAQKNRRLRPNPLEDNCWRERPLPPEPPLPIQLEARLRELDSWANNGILTQSTAQYLRERLYEALDAFIDWDAEMLVKSFYAGRDFESVSAYQHPFPESTVREPHAGRCRSNTNESSKNNDRKPCGSRLLILQNGCWYAETLSSFCQHRTISPASPHPNL